jgi:hypothetical protein
LRAWCGQSAGDTWNDDASSEPDASNGVAEDLRVVRALDRVVDRAGFDVSFSGCADPMMSSSSALSTIAAAVEPMPRTTVRLLPDTAVTRISSPVRVTSTCPTARSTGRASTTSDVAPDAYPAPL